VLSPKAIGRLLTLAAVGLLATLSLGLETNAGVEPIPRRVEERPTIKRFSPNSIQLDDPTRAYAGAVNRFGLDLFGAVKAEDSGKNVFISPVSAALALAMVYNGAAAETKMAMDSALRLRGMSIGDVNHACEMLSVLLENPGQDIELTIANSLWLKDNFKFRPDYLERNASSFDALIQTVDFRSAGAAGTINQWVADATRNRIKNIIGSIDPETIMILINAVYFKGAWAEPFDSALTAEKEFYLLSGDTIRQPLMERTDKFNYFATDQFQAIRLPYGDTRMEMQIYLPSQEYGISRLLADVKDDNWRLWQGRFRNQEGTVMLPRFKLEYEKVLNDPLKALGMDIAFDESLANFSGMAQLGRDSVIFIKEVRQKTFLEVNEKGTEAAAATSVTMALATTAMKQEFEPFRMVVDRPFLCAIVDRGTGLVLFLGAIVDPR
jgi:serine protease inhibitor